MKAEPRFSSKSKKFWASVKLISESVGYTEAELIKAPGIDEIIACYRTRNLSISDLKDEADNILEMGIDLIDYFHYRADILNNTVQNDLMDASDAETEFNRLKRRIRPPAKLLPMNKQKGDMKKPLFLTGIINMLIFEKLGIDSFEHDPHKLTLITKNRLPVYILSRRLDGAYPSSINPKVLWEIKEYYYTTTFGSRVADGIYESMLDGFELNDLNGTEQVKVLHYLMVDAKYTWWNKGKSYLCRIVDMLNMGYVDEVLFGREVIRELPNLIDNWH